MPPDATPSPFHAGERQLQQSLGVAERMEMFGRRVIRDHMPDQHRDFYRQLPFMVLGTVDAAGDVWATLVDGKPGFVTSPDARTLQFRHGPQRGDPVLAGLGDGAAVGLLGIELHTRRRNRMNGHVVLHGDGGFAVQVEQAFGNCPQYIQLRDTSWAAPGADAPALATSGTGLPEPLQARITAADTFFVASYMVDTAGRHVDVSHRGGKAGFVRVNADGSLTIPDFAGNLHFNTLGNVLLNPRAGLVFPDFETGDLLHLTGEAELVLESPDIAAFQGAERLWVFRPRRWVLRPGALAIRLQMRPDGWSPNSLMTGDWQQAAARRAAAQLATQWRPFRVTRIVAESRLVRSFHLAPVDGAGLLPHAAGQHLPIRIRPGHAAAPLTRTYTISTAPSDDLYRISVKREGRASSWLHDHVQIGDIIEARAPMGDFVIDAHAGRPVVMLAAGVGITPLLAMLRHIVYEGLRKRRVRPTWLFQAARRLDQRPFDSELAELVARADGAVRHIRVLADTEDAMEGRDFDFAGRLSVDLLRLVLPFDAYEFYLCGPASFMQTLYDQLRDRDVPDSRIRAEGFGPSALVRRPDAAAAVVALPPAAAQPVPVAFARSGKEARWTPQAGTLLDLAEARGLAPDYSCRSGSCGTCATRLLAGRVTYPLPPQANPGPDMALICSAVPAEGSEAIILDV